MKTLLTSIVFLFFLATVLNANLKPDTKASKMDIKSPQSVADYLLNVAKNAKQVSRNDGNFFALPDERLVSSYTETRDYLDGEFGDWYPYSKSEYTFNEAGQLTDIYEYYLDDETMELALTMRMELEYNADGNMSRDIIYIFSPESAQFLEFMKVEMEYNLNETMRGIVIYQMDFMEMNWFVYQKETFEYNDGNLTEESHFAVHSESGELINISYIDYFYDNSGYLDMSNEFMLDEMSGEFMPYYEIDYTTDNDGKVIEATEYFWILETESWMADGNTIYEYDASGNPSMELFKYAYDEPNIFYDTEKIEYSYATELNYDNYMMPIKSFFYPDYSEHIVNVPLGYIEYEIFDDNWEAYSKTSYLYANGLSSVDDIIKSSVNIFPNPASEFIEISLPENYNFNSAGASCEIGIYDLPGNLVFNSLVSKSTSVQINRDTSAGGGQVRIDVSHLTKGVYFVKIGSQIVKFVKN